MRRKRPIGFASILNDDGMVACGFLGHENVLGSLSEVSRDSVKSTKRIAEQENNFWKDCKKRMNLNEIEHS